MDKASSLWYNDRGILQESKDRKCQLMSVLEKKMSYRQESAIAALLCSPTIPEAAKTAGVCERTLFRWLQDPVFQQSYRAARREAVSQAIAGLQKASSEAVQTLRLQAGSARQRER